MENTQFIKRVRDKFRVSLLAKISLSIVLFFVVIVASNIFEVSFVCKSVLGDYFERQMHEKIASHEAVTEKSLMELNGFVAQMPVVFPELGKKIAESDFDYIVKTAKQTASLMKHDGYVITDAVGNIKYNSYETKCTRKQLTEFGDFIDWLCVKEDLVYNGYMNFLDQGICLVTAHALPDMSTGEVVVNVPGKLDNDEPKSPQQTALQEYMDLKKNRFIHPFFDFTPVSSTSLKIMLDVKEVEKPKEQVQEYTYDDYDYEQPRQSTQQPTQEEGYAVPLEKLKGCISVYIIDRETEEDSF